MDYAGLLQGFKVNRPLSKEERELELRLDVGERRPHYGLSIIKINSSYMDSVDRYFSGSGYLTLIGAVMLSIGLWFGSLFITAVPRGVAPEDQLLLGLVIGSVILMFFGGSGIYMGTHEAFRHTHYPIRLNRKSRTIWVTRLDGTVFNVPWDETFFALGKGYKRFGVQNWDIRGHVLADDNNTVKETFCFSVIGSQDQCRRHWEFLRRYMEDGPEHLIGQVRYCMPVDGKREGFRSGWERLCAEDVSNDFVYLTMYPLNFVAACARWFAMRTSKIPRWPAEVEAASVIEPNDPFIKDAQSNPPDLR